MLSIIFDTINYAFWLTVWHSFQLIRYIVILAAPTSLVQRIVTGIFGEFKIKVTMDGEKPGKYDTNKYKCEIIIHNRRFFKRVAANDNLGMGESYMDGDWDVENAPVFFKCVSRRSPFPHYLANKVQVATNQQTPALSLRVAEEHYNLGNDLYQLMLDRTMNYTCAYWKEDTKTLEQAQINKMDLIAKKLKLKPGMKVLDIGCGFGATAKYLASKYNVSVVGYNIAKEQVAFARKNCEGLDVEIRVEDYRNATGQYDAVYSIGFFEAVGNKNFREYFEVCHRCLKPEGITLLHTIVASDIVVRTGRWANKYIFPGGELPYMSELASSAKGLFVVEDMHSFAKSYKKTLSVWHKNFNAAWKDDLEKKYGGQVGGRFFRMWNYYLMAAAGGFDSRIIQLVQVVYTKIESEAEYKSVRIE